MSLTLERVESLAPDQASLNAARKLLKASNWPSLASDGNELVWGECQGSGATPYRVVVSERDGGYKCTCPSRKFPCKHSLALMWMRAEGKTSFLAGSPPDWVRDWLSRRRTSTASSTQTEDRPKASIQATSNDMPETAVDAKSAARAEAAKERNRRDRESSILAGLDDLDTWLSDQVSHGLASFANQSTQSCRLIAQRLVDAKASGLASRLERLPSRLFALPESDRPAAAVKELGVLYLLASAYRRQDSLSALLKADIRQMAGWSITREALLADENAVRVEGRWRVIATRNEIQADRLRRLETWLWREGSQEGNLRFAVLIDYVPLATGAASSGYSTGDRIEAKLVFYPSPLPLRAQIESILSGAQSSEDPLDLPQQTLAQAYAGYELALQRLPWLEVWPMFFCNVQVRRQGRSLYVCEDSGTVALPLNEAQRSMASPLLALNSIDGIGLWDGYSFTLCWGNTELGRWENG